MTGTPPPPPPPGSTPPPPPPGGTPPPPPPPAGGGMGQSYPPMPPGQPEAQGSNGMATASMVLGIVGIPLCFIFVPALLAVIFGFIALSQLKEKPGQSGRNQAIAGLVLGFVSLALIVLAIAFGDWETSFDTGFILLR